MTRLHRAIAQLLDVELDCARDERTREILDYLRSDEVAQAAVSTWTGPEAARLIEARFPTPASSEEHP